MSTGEGTPTPTGWKSALAWLAIGVPAVVAHLLLSWEARASAPDVMSEALQILQLLTFLLGPVGIGIGLVRTAIRASGRDPAASPARGLSLLAGLGLAVGVAALLARTSALITER